MAGEIFIADKATLDVVKTNTDTIKSDTGTIKAKTNLIGVANPTTAGTDTVMNYLKKIDGNTSGGQIILPKHHRSNTGYNTYNNIHRGTNMNLLSISGKGKVSRMSLAIKWDNNIGTGSTSKFIIIVDGVASDYPLNIYATHNNVYVLAPLYLPSSSPFSYKHDIINDIYFNSSFELKYYSNDDVSYYSQYIYYFVDYALV